MIKFRRFYNLCVLGSSSQNSNSQYESVNFQDGSGSIQLSEMMEVFGTLYLNEGVDEELATERALKIFGFLDINNDGDVSQEEFIRGCLQDEELVDALSDKSVDPPPLVVETSTATSSVQENIHQIYLNIL